MGKYSKVPEVLKRMRVLSKEHQVCSRCGRVRILKDGVCRKCKGGAA
jgi:hypothetical protein